MRTSAFLPLALGLTLCLAACKTSGKDGEANQLGSDYEGDDAGECTDGADNDRDGYFDCQDNGCWGHPDCDGYTGVGPGGGPGGTGTASGGSGTGTGTGTTAAGNCPGAAQCDLTSMYLTVHFDVDFTEWLQPLGFCDCYIDFEGTGTVNEYDAANNRLEFSNGTWVRTDPGANTTTTPSTGTGTGTGTGGIGGTFEPCDPTAPPPPCENFISEGFWWTEEPVYHNFFWDPAQPPTYISDWITHRNPGAWTPTSNPSANQQFYVTQLFAPYDHTQASPFSEADQEESDPNGSFDVYTHWEVTFQK